MISCRKQQAARCLGDFEYHRIPVSDVDFEPVSQGLYTVADIIMLGESGKDVLE